MPGKNDYIDVYPQDLESNEHELDSRFNEVNEGADLGYGKRLPLILILDTSSSMNGRFDGVKAIDELNEGLKILKSEIMKNEIARFVVEPQIITFGGMVNVLQDFTTIDNFTPPILKASGLTPLAEAINQGVDSLKNRLEAYDASGLDYYKSIIFLVTDGQQEPKNPTMMDIAVKKVHAVNDICTFFPVGTATANFNALQAFAVNQPVVELMNMDFKAMFEFISRSVTIISSSQPGQTLALPPANCFKPITA
ncbi:vWA domain-containing protein [Rhodohalobacter mucosus]|uniref:VWFA domain-containing protein n=1 Tax=Rhodohalobacter mucosus TaxID=2079485 RepID=A0A316TSP8_9BACT|nr:hypothetical protein [Rhodohalobacter mucosus]PWN06369.1 hypothetical protein DDZ15_11145 [Rhodohalobacter mucosus]